MKTLLVLLLLIPSLSWGDHYDTSWPFKDPHIRGCIMENSLETNFKDKCIYRSGDIFFNEQKHKCSLPRAYEICMKRLTKLGYQKLRNFTPNYSGDYWVECWGDSDTPPYGYKPDYC